MMFMKAVAAGRRRYPIITDGLKLYLDAYNLDSYSGSGGTWTDLSNSAYNVTITGPTWTVSGDRRYFEFDGVNDYMVGSANTTIFDINTVGWTWSVWIYWVTSPAFLDVILNGEYGTTGKIPYFLDNRSTANTGAGYYTGCYTDTGYVDRGTRINQTVTTGVWRHVCSTFSYTTTTTGTFTLYIDGSQQAQTAANLSGTGLTWSSFNNSKKPYFGVLLVGASDLQRYNNIRLGEVLNYNRALTGTEISNNYNSTKSNYGL